MHLMDAVTMIIVLAIVAPYIVISIRQRRARERRREIPRLAAKFGLGVQVTAGRDTITSLPLSLWAWWRSCSWLTIVTVTIPLLLVLIIACGLLFDAISRISRTTDVSAVFSKV